MPKLATKRPVSILMVVLIVLLLGVVSFTNMAIDLMPKMDFPMLVLSTNYPSAGPEEVEETLTRPYEAQMATIGGIKKITSQSDAGSSLLILEFDYGTNLDEATNVIRDRLELMSMLVPSDVEKSSIIKMDFNMMPIMMLTVTGERHLDDLRTIVDKTIVPKLESTSGVAAVTVAGGNINEVRVEIDPLKLQAYGVTPEMIANVLRSENANYSGGYVVAGSQEMLVRVTGEIKSLAVLADLPLATAGGGQMRLGDLANIRYGAKDTTSIVRIDGQDAISIAIQKASDGNTVQVDKAVKAALAELDKTLYDDVAIGYAYNQADFINISINSVIESAYMSALLAIVVLLIFLRNIRSTFVIATAIPISIIATFVMLYFAGQTLNMLTLGGLALGVGMMVDNAIVVLENIYRHRSLGKGRIAAAVEGANEVAMPIVASTLTTVAVFFPIVFVQGLASEIFTPMALAIGFSLTASLIVALAFVPMLSSKILVIEEPDLNKRGLRGFLSRLNHRIGLVYERIDLSYSSMIDVALRHKVSVVVITLVALVGSIALAPQVGMAFLPKTDAGQINISLELPPNTRLTETTAMVTTATKIISEIPEVQSIFSSAGRAGGMSMGTGANHIGSFTVLLTPSNERTRSIGEVSRELEERLGTLTGIKVDVKEADMMSMGASSDIAVKISGDDMATLEELAGEVTTLVRGVTGTIKTKSSFSDAVEELSIRVNRDKATFYGISSTQVYATVSLALQGKTISQYTVSGIDVDVKLYYPDGSADNLDKLRQLQIPSATGGYVPLEEVADITQDLGQQSIIREDQRRVVTVSADVYGRDLGSVSADIQSRLDQMPLPAGYQVSLGGMTEEMNRAMTDLALALLMAILLVYMIMASQFEELLHPFIILFSLPPTLIGVVLMLLVTGQTLNLLSMIGLIMLAGIVVNNAIVLVDYINVLRRDHGLPLREAIVTSGKTRLRPILMTTLTTVCGMLPQLLSRAEGAELMRPLAATIIGGLTFSTLISLILVPVMYEIMERLVSKIKGRFFKVARD